nr:hypothetical protein [Angustibacter aerolatus]
MRERGHGAIVTVSSVAGYVTMGGYSALKAFVTTWSESLSVEPGRQRRHRDRPRAGLGAHRVPRASRHPHHEPARPGLGRRRPARRGVPARRRPRPRRLDPDDPLHHRRLARPARPRAAVRAVSGRLAGSRRR